MSTIILEVEESHRELLLGFLETLPYVRCVRQEPPVPQAATPRGSSYGKFRHLGVSTKTLERENALNKALEDDSLQF